MTTRAAVIEWARSRGLNVDDVLHDWGERSGIREFCGGMSRDEAETCAMQDVITPSSSR